MARPITAPFPSLRLALNWRALTTAGVALTLALLPFEDQLPSAGLGAVSFTGLEFVWLATIALWILGHVARRSLPRLPPPLLAGLAVMLAAGLASAVLADGHVSDSLRFVVRSASGWLLCLVVIDLVRNGPAAVREVGVRWATAALVGGATVAAVIGLLAQFGLAGPLEPIVGKSFLVGGVARLRATFDYPNTAGMAFEASAFVAAGLLGAAFARARGARVAAAIALGVLVLAMLLTLSRGASLGAGAGLAAIAGLALLARRFRTAAATLAGIAGLLLFTVMVQLGSLPVDRLFTEGDRSFYGATYSAPTEIHVDANGLGRTTVVVTNTGAATWDRTGQNGYQLGYHWLDPLTRRPVQHGYTYEIGPVRTGESVTVQVSLLAPPGERHLLAWDMVHDLVAWFSERGVPVSTSAVVAVAAQPGTPNLRPLPTGRSPTMLLYPELPPEPARGELWGAALLMIDESPLLGVGPGTFRLRYGDYLGWEVWSTAIHSNNLYLELAATTGLIGLAAFLVVVAYALWRPALALLRRPGGRDWMLRAALVGAVVAYLAHGFVDYFLGFNGTGGLFWAVLGLGYGLSQE